MRAALPAPRPELLLRCIAALSCAVALAGCPSIPDRPDAAAPAYDPSTGNRFDAPLSLSDARVQRVDLSAIPAPGGACHPTVIGVVDRIVDGDTIHVTVPADGMNYDVRMIGVNAPEIAHEMDGGASPADCFGYDAMAFTELLRGRTVILSFDAGCEDPYGRLLAYVWVGSGPGDLWQRQLLRRGFARVLSIEPNTSRASTFQEDEDAARSAGTGLWGACP